MALSHAAAARAIPSPEFGQHLLGQADALRVTTTGLLNPKRRGELGQFMTPAPVASLMASMIGATPSEVKILDAGAGVGSLTAAAIAELLSRDVRPARVHVTAFEIDPVMATGLRQTLEHCAAECGRAGIEFESQIFQEDFLDRAASWLSWGMFAGDPEFKFNLAIQNPPYKKMHAASRARSLARSMGIETSNLYTAFLTATMRLMDDGGQLVAISPRSFCNGPYFQPFRELLLNTMSLDRIHVFQSRQEAFKEDEVLQETVILSAYKCAQQNLIEISSSKDAVSPIASRSVPISDVVSPSDSNRFIHIRSDDEAAEIAAQMAALPCTLADLKLKVSTGRVVDFRAKEHLRLNPDAETIPLIYPGDMLDGFIVWPRQARKPKALHLNSETQSLTVPAGPYVLTKRFSAKEERRRVVAAVFDPAEVPAESIGIENHLNYFHRAGNPLDLDLAKGLAAFLNTTLVDCYFRQFNGHTQVNATDLRTLRYPSEAALRIIGSRTAAVPVNQNELDAMVGDVLA